MHLWTSPTTLAAILLGLAGHASATCNANNCLRAVRRAVTESNGLGDCQSYLATTVVPPTVTQTATVTVVGRFRRQQDGGSTILATARPSYASACSSVGAYSSACLCVGASPTVITATAPLTTITITSTISDDPGSTTSTTLAASSTITAPITPTTTTPTTSADSASSCPVCTPSTVITTLPDSTQTCSASSTTITITVTEPVSTSSTTSPPTSTTSCIPSISTLTITPPTTTVTQTVTTSAPCIPPPPPRPCPGLTNGNFFLRFGTSNVFLDGQGDSNSGTIIAAWPGHLWRFETSASPYRLQYVGLPGFPTFGAAGQWMYMEASTNILRLAPLTTANSLVAAGTAHWPVCQYDVGVVRCSVGAHNTLYSCPGSSNSVVPILQTPTYAGAGCVRREAMVTWCTST